MALHLAALPQVRIWDCRIGKCAHAIETRGENINIRWSPDGHHIAVGDKEDNISLEQQHMNALLNDLFQGDESTVVYRGCESSLFEELGPSKSPS